MLESAQSLAEAAARCVGEIDPNDADALLRAIGGSKRVFFVGAGRTGLVARGMVMRLRQLGREAFMAGEAATPAANTKDLVVVCSGSFRSTTTLAIYHRTVDAKIPTAVVTTSEAPKNYGKASLVVLIPVGERARLAPLGTLFELSLQLLFDGMVLALMGQLGVPEKSMRARHATLE
jgi:6-phospho-3-hexuloisomerase